MARKKEKEPSFEENLAEIENIVAQMEKGELPLADLMDGFKRGVELSQRCLQALSSAEAALDVTLKETQDGLEEFALQLEGE